MLLLDFLSHALNSLTASVPSLLTPTLVSDPKTENPPQTLATPIPRNPHSNYDTPGAPNPQPERRLQKPPPTKLSLTIDAPLRTSHKRHDSMNSAKMNNSNVQVVQAVPSARDAGVLNPHTGFHEPLSPDRNTTLTHPDADTSENASIEAEDLELTRTRSRSRFLHRNGYKRSIHGKLEPSEEPVMNSIPATNGTVTNGHAASGLAANGGGEESEDSAGKSEEELKIRKEGVEQGYLEAERKKGLLRKLHLHKA